MKTNTTELKDEILQRLTNIQLVSIKLRKLASSFRATGNETVAITLEEAAENIVFQLDDIYRLNGKILEMEYRESLNAIGTTLNILAEKKS